MKIWQEYLSTRVDHEDFLYWFLVRKLSMRGKYLLIGMLWAVWIWLVLDLKRLWFFFVAAIGLTVGTLLISLLYFFIKKRFAKKY